MTYICIEIFSGALRGCGDVRVPPSSQVFAVCIMRIVWLAVALPFKHELSVVEFSYPLTWITATVLFAIYYARRLDAALHCGPERQNTRVNQDEI